MLSDADIESLITFSDQQIEDDIGSQSAPVPARIKHLSTLLAAIKIYTRPDLRGGFSVGDVTISNQQVEETMKLFDDLAPTVHIHKGWGKRLETKYYPDNAITECTVTKDLTITEGTLEDYRKLAEFHYRNPKAHAAVRKIFALKTKNDETVGCIMYSYPPLATFGRRKALGRQPSIEELNRDFSIISRVVLHPKYRSTGLGIRLVRETLPLAGTPYVETVAVMARYNPFFEKGGMTKITEAHGDATIQTAIEKLTALGFKPYALASQETNLTRLGQLNLRDIQKVKEALQEVSQGYYKRLKASGKAYVRKTEYAKFISEASKETLAKVLSRLAILAQTKAYLFWRKPSIKFKKTENSFL
jgi:GNAT superfamily N-acetyltransferase